MLSPRAWSRKWPPEVSALKLRRRSTDLKVDHQVYPDGESIWNCGCAFRMSQVLETGLYHQPWSDRASVCPLDGGFEIPHRYGHARRIAGLFRWLETWGI